MPRPRQAEIRVGAPPRRRRSGAPESLCDFFRVRVFVYTTRSFLTKQTRARRRALMARGARGASARGARPTATVATFAARIRVDLARRARRTRCERGRDLFGAYGYRSSDGQVSASKPSRAGERFVFPRRRDSRAPQAHERVKRAEHDTRRPSRPSPRKSAFKSRAARA